MIRSCVAVSGFWGVVGLIGAVDGARAQALQITVQITVTVH